MSEAANATCSVDAFAIGSYLNGTQLLADASLTAQPPIDCTLYSGNSYSSIAATTITKINDTTNETLNGVAITYSGGATCASTGLPTSFTINSWCNSSIAVANTEYSGLVTGGDVCNPSVDIYSSIGGCDIFSNSIIWVYLDYAKPYFGAAAIAIGFALTFFGLKLIRPSVCFAGFLTCTVLSLLIFYGVYITSVS